MKPDFVILDRDGVINEDSDDYIKSINEWIPIESSIQAIAILSKNQVAVAIATNQSGIGRGYYTLDTMHQIHNKLKELASNKGGRIEYIAYCPHLPKDGCHCRKPEIGLIEEIKQNCNIQVLENCYFIGDSYKDIQAAQTAGCVPILVKTGKGKETLLKHPELIGAIPIYENLHETVTKHFKMG